jgi:DNA-binding MarR family transcriptional regulator
MSRDAATDDLYQGLVTLVRRSRDLGTDLHPGLSVIAYALLTQIEVMPDPRAADLAAYFGLDKSTLSRQLEQLIAAGLLRRVRERPGRRGQPLVVTAAGRRKLATAATRIRARLAEWLADWEDQDIATFASLVTRFNRSTG